MKRVCLLLTSVFQILLISFNSYSQKSSTPVLLDNISYEPCDFPPHCQEEPLCTYSDDCFRFDYYKPRDLGNGTSMMKFKITNFSETHFQRAAFELPGKGAATQPAISPTTNFRNRFRHDVINPANDSMLVFKAKNGNNFTYGNFEVYYYIVRNVDLLSSYGRFITVRARAASKFEPTRTGKVVIDRYACEGITPEQFCLKQESDNFILGFPFYDVDADNNFPLYFKLFNKSDKDIEYIEIDPAPISAVLPLHGSTYNSPFNVPFYAYDVSNASPLRFTRSASPPSTTGFANGASDQFNFAVKASDFFANGSVVTVIVKTEAAQDTFRFECAECGPIIPLPVTLTSFNAKYNPTSQQVLVSWQTSMEKDNKGFTVERSADGKTFATIGEVPGSPNGNQLRDYKYLDRQPLPGTSFYRLKQTDFDGTTAHSKIVVITSGENRKTLAINLAPNPCANGDCEINIANALPGSGTEIKLVDLTGRVIFKETITGETEILRIPAQKVKGLKGVFLLHAKSGDAVASQRIVLP